MRKQSADSRSDLPKVTQCDREELKFNPRSWGTAPWPVVSAPCWPHDAGSPWGGGQLPLSLLLASGLEEPRLVLSSRQDDHDPPPRPKLRQGSGGVWKMLTRQASRSALESMLCYSLSSVQIFSFGIAHGLPLPSAAAAEKGVDGERC